VGQQPPHWNGILTASGELGPVGTCWGVQIESTLADQFADQDRDETLRAREDHGGRVLLPGLCRRGFPSPQIGNDVSGDADVERSPMPVGAGEIFGKRLNQRFESGGDATAHLREFQLDGR